MCGVDGVQGLSLDVVSRFPSTVYCGGCPSPWWVLGPFAIDKGPIRVGWTLGALSCFPGPCACFCANFAQFGDYNFTRCSVEWRREMPTACCPFSELPWLLGSPLWFTQQWPQDWKRSVFIPIPKKGNPKECSDYCIIALISHASKEMLKILQARLQPYVNCELPDVQAGFRKGRETRDQIANICWIIKKERVFQKNIYFCFIDYAKAFDCVDHNKLWKILNKMGILDHLTCLLRNLYACQEATVITGHGTADWFQIGKGVRQGCTSLCLFNL